MPRRSHLPHALARMAFFALLVIGLVLQPVLAAIGETHELTHAGAMLADGHVGDGHDLDEHGAAEGEGPQASADGDSVSHAALHFAHCCGQAPTVLASTHVAVPKQFAGSVVPENAPRLALDATVFEPQRPPIL